MRPWTYRSPAASRKALAESGPRARRPPATALEKDRDRRYKTALDLAEDLRRVRMFEPIQARPAGPILRFQRWVQRNPVAATATLALFLFLTTGLAISLALLGRVQREKEAKDGALAEKEAALLEKDSALLERGRALEEKDDALARLREAMRAAEEERDKAEGLYLTGRASNVLSENPSQAMLLALAASERYRGRLLGDVLLGALSRQREERVFLDYGRSMRLASWSPDGERLVTVSNDGAVRIRDGKSGERLHLLVDPGGAHVAAVDFHPDGTFLAGATTDGRVVLWDLRRGATVAVFESHLLGWALTAVRFSPDGRRIVTGSIDGRARVWDTANASRIAILEGHECAILSAEFSPDAERVLTASSGFVHLVHRDAQGRVIGRGAAASGKLGPTTARVWDAGSGRQLLELGGHRGPVKLAAWSTDGERLLTVSSAGTRIHRADTGELVREVKRSASDPRLDVARLSLDGRRFLALDYGGELSVGDASSGEEIARLRPGRREVPASPPVFDRTGSRLAVAGPGDGVEIWSVDSGEKLLALRGHEGEVRSIGFHPRDGRLLTASSDGTARIWDTSRERELGDLLPREAGVGWSRFSPDGRCAVVVLPEGERRVISVPDGDLVARFEPERPAFSLYSKEPIDFAVSAEDGRLLTASRGTLRLWDSGGKTLIAATSLHGTGLDISPDGETVAFLDPEGKLVVVSVKKGRLFEVEAGGPRRRERFSAVRFLDGGREVMALSSSPSLRVWQVPGGSELEGFELGAHFDAVPELVGLDPEGRRLLLHPTGGPLKVFDALSGEVLASSGSYPEGILEAELDPWTGRLLVVTPATVEIRDVAGGLVASIPAGEKAFAAGAFGPNGERVLTLDLAGKAEIRDAGKGTRLVELDPGAPIHSASFSPDGGRVLVASLPRTIALFDAGTGRRIFSTDDHARDIVAAIFVDEGAVALAVMEDGALQPWDALTGEKLDAIEKAVFGPRGRTYFSREFSFSRDGLMLLETSLSRWQAGRAWVRDARTGEVLLELGESTPLVDLVEISPDGSVLFVGRKERLPPLARRLEDVQARRRGTAFAPRDALELKLVDIPAARARIVLESPGAFPERIEFSPSGDVVAGVTASEVVAWDARSGRVLGRLDVPASADATYFAPGGRRLLVLTGRGDPVPARLWDLEVDETVELRAAISPTAGAFAPGGRQVVIGSSDGSLVVFDAGTGELARTFFAHGKVVHDVAFSPDGRWLASGSEDGTARIRNAAEGVEDLVFPHAGGVTFVEFTADGSRLLTVEDDGTPRVWLLDVVGLARESKVRELTPDERDRFEVGSPAEREAYRREWEERVLCELIEETGRALAADPSNLHVLALARARVASLSSLGRAGESKPQPIECLEDVFRRHDLEHPDFLVFRSELRVRSGDLRGAIIGLEEVIRRFGEEPGPARQLELWRRQALPDLVSYASIDAALERGEPFIAEGDEWRFFRGRRVPAPALDWTLPGYDDGGWEKGPSGFGYGYGDEGTVIDDMRGSYTTLYLRRRFTVSDLGEVAGLTLALRVDDGLVAYLNGREVFRVNAPGSPGRSLDSSAEATVLATEPLPTLEAEINPSFLREGLNLLAIHALNKNLTSSDLSVVPELRVSRVPDLARDRREFAGFLSRTRGEDAALRIAYFEGRLRERAERFREAIPFFERVIAGDPAAIEPLLSLASCLRRSGDAAAALPVIARAIDAASEAADTIVHARLWRTWFETYVVDLRRSPQEALSFLRRRASGGSSLAAPDHGWVLRELVERGAIRIACGRIEPYKDADGTVWGRDRFFAGGLYGQRGGGRGDVTAPLRETERYFVPRGSEFLGYRIPLPPGAYRVVLHFGEFRVSSPGERVFDVLVEGRKVLEDYDPFAAAGAEGIDVRTAEVTVDDGLLEIRFVAEFQNPKVTAIEIRPAG